MPCSVSPTDSAGPFADTAPAGREGARTRGCHGTRLNHPTAQHMGRVVGAQASARAHAVQGHLAGVPGRPGQDDPRGAVMIRSRSEDLSYERTVVSRAGLWRLCGRRNHTSEAMPAHPGRKQAGSDPLRYGRLTSQGRAAIRNPGRAGRDEMTAPPAAAVVAHTPVRNHTNCAIAGSP